jgi:hypothetical protein
MKEQLPYERVLSRIRRRNVQELEFQLEDIFIRRAIRNTRIFSIIYGISDGVSIIQ